MSKREFPLFVFDLARDHGLGECDFVSCTDADNAFIAKIDYVEGVENIITDTLRINRGNGTIKLRLEVKRITGKNPDKGAIRTLLKKAEDLYCERTQKKVNMGAPSKADMVHFLNTLIKGNKQYVSQAGADVEERDTALMSIAMLEAIKNELEE